MVLDKENTVKAERLGLANIIDIIGIILAVADLIVDFRARAAEQSEPHRRSPDIRHRVGVRLRQHWMAGNASEGPTSRANPIANGAAQPRPALAVPDPISSCCPPGRSPARRRLFSPRCKDTASCRSRIDPATGSSALRQSSTDRGR